MRFSLIQATLGRTVELSRFLEALVGQTHRDFELIVVDQNQDDRLVPLLDPSRVRFPILHLRSTRGLSRARNVGLKAASGEVLAFPDDDCWYPVDYLERVAGFLRSHPAVAGLSGRPMSPDGKPVLGQYDADAGPVNRFNIWRRVNSNTLCIRRGVIETVGGFDETLGVGAGTPWGSAEDIDLPLRGLARGLGFEYVPDCSVFHDDDLCGIPAEERARKAYRYGLGTGRVLRKHRYPVWFLAYAWLGPLKPAARALFTGRPDEARLLGSVAAGRVRGWLGWA